MKTILSLFDYSGNWSLPYKENGYKVIQVDIKLGIDILTWNYNKVGKIYGILAAIPCDHYCNAGARWWAEKDKDGRTEESLKLVDKTLEIIAYFSPTFWVIENPVGRLNKLRPALSKYGPKFFQPYWYGDPYRKKTGLWGVFNFPQPTNIVQPEGVRVGQPDEWYSKMGGKSEKTKEYRSITPMGFAKAFYEANK